ncbi:MAG: zinc ribbon domain-containing protein [Ruminococcaceae bacterium]|nr:zinc ribbon domain-containing protein [Oscillospiraceae bacterium]
MALITCYECGQQMSDKAPVCPHCGAPAGGAAEERKCGECGAVLPEGAAVCPSCGCPAEGVAVNPAPVSQPAYVAPTVAPAHVQLGSATQKINDTINEKTKNVNVWLFLFSAAAVVAYLFAFVKYMKFLNGVLDISSGFWGTLGTIAVDLAADGAASNFFNTCKLVRFMLIAALGVMGIALFFDIKRLSQKKLMSNWWLGIAALEIAGFWVPMGILTNTTGLKSDLVEKTLNLFTQDNFGTYIKVVSGMIAVLFIVSVCVAVSVPKVTDYCQHCGRYVQNEGAGGVCRGCGQRKYLPGFKLIPREIVNAYPYSGETIVGTSQLDQARLIFTILGALLFGGLAIVFLIMVIMTEELKLLYLFFSAVFLLPTIFIVVNLRNGLRSKITVTPTNIELIDHIKRKRLKAPVSKITDVLTNESGDLAVCACGVAYIFKDISEKARIAAALETLTSNNQMN